MDAGQTACDGGQGEHLRFLRLRHGGSALREDRDYDRYEHGRDHGHDGV